MTNKPMLSVERELLERAIKACTFVGYEGAAKELRALLDAQNVVCSNGILCQNSKCAECGGNGTYKPVEVNGEDVLRWMDEHAAAQYQGHAIPQWLRDHFSAIEDEAMKLGGCGVFTKMRTKVQAYFETVRKQGEPVAEVEVVEGDSPHVHLYQDVQDGTKLYADQPSPVAVVMPDDWEDQLFSEMSRRFDLRKMIDDDHMVYDDTQIGVEFARDWIKARLNGAKL